MGCCCYGFYFPAPEPGYTETKIRAMNTNSREVQLHDYNYRRNNQTKKAPYLFLPCYPSNDKSQISDRCIIYFHGNAQDIGHSVEILHSMRRSLQMNIFAMEYPGYGLINGQPKDPDVMKRNARGFYKMVNERLGFRNENIVVFGRSIGSGPASHVAGMPEVKTLVLMSPISSIRGVTADHTCRCLACCIPNFFDNQTEVADTNAKLLVIHGKRDEVVPFHNGQKVVRAYEQGKPLRRAEFIPIESMTHNNFDLERDILQNTAKFLLTAIPGTPSTRDAAALINSMKQEDDMRSEESIPVRY